MRAWQDETIHTKAGFATRRSARLRDDDDFSPLFPGEDVPDAAEFEG